MGMLQTKHLQVGGRVDLVHHIARTAASLTVQIERLYEDRVIGQTL